VSTLDLSVPEHRPGDRNSSGGFWRVRTDQTRPGPATMMQRFLKVPLATKLAGANVLVALAALGASYAAFRNTPAEWRLITVVTVALAIGFAVNVLLVRIALRPIRDLERTATRVWAGDLETRVPRSPIADADLAQVGGTLNFLLNALSEDRARVRTLAKEVVRTGDRERSRVGKELHDSVAQSLAALRYQLIAIEREAGDGELTEQIRAVRNAAGEVLEQVRLLSHTVHPQILDDLGLVPALRHLARTTTDGPAITVVVEPSVEADLRAIPNEIAVGMYRAAREAVANALRHASPTTIRIEVGLAGGELVMQVEDNGRGFDRAEVERDGRAMGLFTMRERTALLNGDVEITSAPQRGTSVRVRVPVDVARGSAPARAAIQLEKNHAG
jgi:two-component system, NarL family, sensor histidine kinase UhpB